MIHVVTIQQSQISVGSDATQRHIPNSKFPIVTVHSRTHSHARTTATVGHAFSSPSRLPYTQMNINCTVCVHCGLVHPRAHRVLCQEASHKLWARNTTEGYHGELPDRRRNRRRHLWNRIQSHVSKNWKRVCLEMSQARRRGCNHARVILSHGTLM